jgi:hypothetical protein
MAAYLIRMIANKRLMKSVTPSASDFFDAGLVSIIMKHNNSLFQQLDCQCISGVPDIQSFQSLEFESFQVALRESGIKCMTEAAAPTKFTT